MNQDFASEASALSPTDLIAHIRNGMAVVGAARVELGKVEFVKMGDPEAVTTRGNRPLAGEPDVPEPLRSQLLRYGFIKVDGHNLTDTDRYVCSDQVATVADNTITLRVGKEQLLREREV